MSKIKVSAWQALLRPLGVGHSLSLSLSGGPWLGAA